MLIYPFFKLLVTVFDIGEFSGKTKGNKTTDYFWREENVLVYFRTFVTEHHLTFFVSHTFHGCIIILYRHGKFQEKSLFEKGINVAS